MHREAGGEEIKREKAMANTFSRSFCLGEISPGAESRPDAHEETTTTL